MACFAEVFVAIACYLSLFATVTSSPTFLRNTGKTLSLSVGHDADAPRHGPSEYLKTLKKYKLDIPDGLQELVDTYKATNNKAVVGDGGE